MLEHLRRRVSEALSKTREATLSTFGPARLQAAVVLCEFENLRLYALIPRTSDQRFNLETNPDVVATADGWQLRGRGRIVAPGEWPRALRLRVAAEAAWCDLVEIVPDRAQLFAGAERAEAETVDFA